MPPSLPPRIRVLDDADAACRTAADRILDAVRGAAPHPACLVLAGGSTPAPTYRLLAGAEGEDRRLLRMAQIFPSDERPTPPDDARSNYGMHRRLLLDRLEVPVENQHAFPAWEKQPSQGALEAEAELRRVVRPRLEGGLPAFDLALLGLGADGHTASLFPGTEPLEETEAWIVPTVRPEDGEVRLTLTYPALRRAGTLLFLVTGKEKSEAVRRALRPEGSAPPPPAVRVDQGRGLWILDRAAASDLSADLFE